MISGEHAIWNACMAEVEFWSLRRLLVRVTPLMASMQAAFNKFSASMAEAQRSMLAVAEAHRKMSNLNAKTERR